MQQQQCQSRQIFNKIGMDKLENYARLLGFATFLCFFFRPGFFFAATRRLTAGFLEACLFAADALSWWLTEVLVLVVAAFVGRSRRVVVRKKRV